MENEALVGHLQRIEKPMEHKWVIIGALGNLLLCILNIINLVRHWNQ